MRHVFRPLRRKADAKTGRAGQVANLLRLAMRIQQEENLQPVLSESPLKSALRELLVALPVYRTYGADDRRRTRELRP